MAGVALILRRYRQSQFARYEALSTADPGLDDEGEEEAVEEERDVDTEKANLARKDLQEIWKQHWKRQKVSQSC